MTPSSTWSTSTPARCVSSPQTGSRGGGGAAARRSLCSLIGCNLPSLQDLFPSRSLRRTREIVADRSHPGHTLFECLPSGGGMRSIRTVTPRHTQCLPVGSGAHEQSPVPRRLTVIPRIISFRLLPCTSLHKYT